MAYQLRPHIMGRRKVFQASGFLIAASVGGPKLLTTDSKDSRTVWTGTNVDLLQSAELFELGHPVFGRLDTAGSELFMPAEASDTELFVGTRPGGRRWITTTERPGDFPFNVLVGGGEAGGGEVVRVEGIVGTEPEQIFTVVRGVESSQHDWLVGTAVQLSSLEVEL